MWGPLTILKSDDLQSLISTSVKQLSCVLCLPDLSMCHNIATEQDTGTLCQTT